MTIPKIIHNIAPADKTIWHEFWNQCYQSWKKQFPNYEFKLWNDQEDINNLVREYYPRYWNLYLSFPVHIMRIDFVRLCILHKFGGIYSDMDIYCYKNFEHFLDKEIYFLENLTCEYTSAEFENSMMASTSNHRFLEELMKYTQACFIHHRNMFKKQDDSWRNIENDKIINNTTGSGMISEAVKNYLKYFDIGAFDCKLFNNRPMSYDEQFYTKHMHTSIWGNEYTKNNLDRLLLINGSAYATSELSEETLKELVEKDYQIILNEDFDFYKDYTNGMYLRDDNLEQIKKIVENKY